MTKLGLRLRSLFQRHRVEGELDEELQFHLEKQVEQNLAAGMSAHEARYTALKEFGGIEQRKEECRDARRVNMMSHFWQDLTYAVRAFGRDRALFIAATLTLAICIGANTTVFSLVNSILVRPLPYPSSERIVWLTERMGRDQMEMGLGPDYYSLRAENRVFEDVAGFDNVTVNWTGADAPLQLDAAQVTPSFFRVMGSPPLLGRTLAENEQGVKAPPVVVVSFAFWRSRLASYPSVVGKPLTLDGLPNTVIGVMPQGFDYPKGTQIWRPLSMDEASQRRSANSPVRMLNMLARLKAEVSQPQLDSELARLTRTIRAEYPKEFERMGFLDRMAILATPLQRRITGDLRPALQVLSGAVALVLLIACANLANLLLARATARQRELAVRMALGSGRGRIIRQVLTESLALALPGGLIGIGLAYLAVSGLNHWKPLVLDRYPAISLDFATLGFSLGITLLTGVVFGMAPALAAAGINIQDALKSASHTQSGARRTAHLRQLLVVGELAMSLVLLVGAGLLARSFLKLAGTNLGFRPENLLTLRTNLSGSRYKSVGSQVSFYQDVMERVGRLPSVQSTAITTAVPLAGDHPFQSMRFQVYGRTPLPMAQQPQTSVDVVSPGYFRTLGISVRRGRIFDAQDTTESDRKIVVNEALARKIFAGEDPIGQRLTSGFDGANYATIVGVVGDVRGSALGAEPEPLLYRCVCQAHDPFLTRMKLIVRSTSDPQMLSHDVAAQVYAVDRDRPVFDVRTMDERVANALSPQRFNLILIGTFACIALVLASLGVYGVISYQVTRRTREIGIRMAMGAQRADVLKLVVAESLVLALIGVAAGLAGASVLTRYLKSMLYGVTAWDTPTLVTMTGLLAGLAIVASLMPARRAAQIDPNSALREE